MNDEKKEPVSADGVHAAGDGTPPTATSPSTAGASTSDPVANDTDVKSQETSAGAPCKSDDSPAAQRSTGFSVHARRAAVLATAIGLGWAGGWATSLASGPESGSSVGSARDWVTGSLFRPRPEQGEARQLAGDVQALKSGLEEVKASLDRNRHDDAQRLTLIGERLDAVRQAEREGATQLASLVQRAEQATGTKLAGLTDRFEKIELADRDPTPRLTQIAERLERLERQLTAAPLTPVAKPVTVAANDPPHTNAVPVSKPPTVENWALRDVYNGVALIEGKNRRLMEIVPGQNLPGVGRVEAIERKGKTWIVVTSRGVITSQAW